MGGSEEVMVDCMLININVEILCSYYKADWMDY